MRTIQYTISPQDSGKTVEQFLKGQGVSRRVITALKKTPDGLLLGGVHTRTIDRLAAGDVLELNLSPTPKRMPVCDIPVPVLYQDEDVLVYNKPADMPCHQSGGHIHGTLSGVWAAHCLQTGAVTPFRAVNRLDKDTTGAVVAARNQLAAGKLWKQVSKVYLAVVAGSLPQDTGLLDWPIEREIPYEMKRIVTPDGQRAVTQYQVLDRDPSGGCTLAAFVLHTGRTHQIRVHMAHLGHPVVGDPLYRGPQEELTHQALHCGGVQFPQVVTGEPVTVLAPLPPDLIELLERHHLTLDWDVVRQLLVQQEQFLI